MIRSRVKRSLLIGVLSAAAALLPACTITVQSNICPATAVGCCPGNAACVLSGSIFVAAGNQIIHFHVNPATGVLSQAASVTTTNPVFGVLSPIGSNFVYAVDATQSAIVGYTASGSALSPVPGSPYFGADGQARPTSDGTFLYMPGSSGQGLGVYSIGPFGGLTFLNPVPGIQQSSTPFYSTVVSSVPRYFYASNVAASPGEIDAAAVALNTGVISGVPNSPFKLSAIDGPPGAIAQAGGKFIFVALPAANSVAAFSIGRASGALAPVSGSPFSTGRMPSAVAADFTGSFLYVTNAQDNNVSGFAISSTGALTPVPGSPFPAGSYPEGIAVDNFGHVYLANNDSGNISAYSIDSSTGALTPIPGSPFPAGTRPNSIAFSTAP